MERLPTNTPVRLVLWAALAQATAAFAGCGGGAAGSPVVDAGVEHPAPPTPYARPEYQFLSQTGLFSETASRTVTADALSFQPAYKLWSDGAEKRRWLLMPPGTQIDSSDMDHWVFPIGTKLWKEFSLDGVLLETRLIERYGEGAEDYWMGAFVWNSEQSDATFTLAGEMNIAGTPHDAPAQKACGSCHRGDVGRVLGFSAIQLSAAATASATSTSTPIPTLDQLNGWKWLSHAAAEGGYPIAGDSDTAQAFGYLHANCGHCHNKNGTAWHDTQMVMRLTVTDRDAPTSALFQSLVGTTLQYWRGGDIKVRVAAGAPEASGVFSRMQIRGTDDQMPPLATELVDPTGLDLVRRWITALAP